jgi:hypothetical protein
MSALPISHLTKTEFSASLTVDQADRRFRQLDEDNPGAGLARIAKLAISALAHQVQKRGEGISAADVAVLAHYNDADGRTLHDITSLIDDAIPQAEPDLHKADRALLEAAADLDDHDQAELQAILASGSHLDS